MTAKKKNVSDKEYVALTGINYISATDGKERRVEAGDTIPAGELFESVVRSETEAGYLAEKKDEPEQEAEADQDPEGGAK